jgi:pimeloyl-ACP methyl ester carboxylesterase
VQFLHGIEAAGGSADGRMDVVFAGYSYGSLVATRLPDPAALLAPFSAPLPPPPLGESAREVVGRARKLADKVNGGALRAAAPGHGRRGSGQRQRQRDAVSGDGACGGGEGADGAPAAAAGAPAARLKEAGGDEPKPSTPVVAPETTVPPSPSPLGLDAHYLLISPLLPPISTLTALPLFAPSADADEEAHLKKFREWPTLAVFGGRDVFTSAHRLAAWCEERRKANARFDWFEVPGAGHFWHERGAMAEANRHVREWVRRNVGSNVG